MLFKSAIPATVLALLFTIQPIISEARKDTQVKSHVRKGGTAVQSYKRKSHNKTKLDNYGTKGNLNPHSGKVGKDDLFDGKGERR